MVQSCSAVNCTTRRTKDVKVKFHRFPKDTHLRKSWLIALRRLNFEPSSSAVICEKHFELDDYFVNVHGNRTLKKEAVPTVFGFASNLKVTTKNGRDLIGAERVLKEPPNENLEDTEKKCDKNNLKENKHEIHSMDIAKYIPETSWASISETQTEVVPGTNDSLNSKNAVEKVRKPVFFGEDTKRQYQISVKEENHESDFMDVAEYSTVQMTSISKPQTEIALDTFDSLEFIENANKKTVVYSRARREPVFFGDFVEDDLEIVARRRRFWNVANKTVEKYKKLHKYYQCKII